MKKIILTGGGTAGHVTPNIALLPYLRENNYEIHYIGSIDGIEKSLIEKESDVTFHEIRTGKLRRYFDLKNFTDPFRVIAGYFDAKKLIKKIKPDVVFSKGGFVAVPVVMAAHSKKVPVVAHESDITPGLANKITKKYATKICLTFPDTLSYIAPPLGVHTGTPIRNALYCGNAESARNMLNFDDKPVILVMGGSMGSVILNKYVRNNLSELTKTYNIVHLCGKNHIDNDLNNINGYRQFEYVSENLPDILALSQFVISRAGSNSIHEFLALQKPMLLIPLSLSASRGDQILNAESFEKRGFCHVLTEDKISTKTFLDTIELMNKDKNLIIQAMSKAENTDGTKAVLQVIENIINK